MARLDTRSVGEGVPLEWVLDEEPFEAPDQCSEGGELREWRMIVAFLQNC
jgi:hypothetical protein